MPHYHDTTHSVDDLIQNARQRLSQMFGRTVRAELAGEELVLRGVVRSWYQKQLAQESFRRVAGVRRLRNELEVVRS